MKVFYTPIPLLLLAGLIFCSCGKGNNTKPSSKTIAKDFSNATAQTVTVSTLAGGAVGNSDGTGSAASFNQPSGITVDQNDNIYITDYGNASVRKITAAGIVTTTKVGGYASGGIAIDNSGDFYVCTSFSSGTVYKITPDGTKSAWPILNVTEPVVYQAFDKSNGNDYVSILGSSTVYKINSQGVASAFADCSTGYTRGNQGIAVDASGSLYVTAINYANSTIGYISQVFKITPAGVVSLYAGAQNYGSTDGPAASATFSLITAMAIDKNDNLFLLDGNKVRMISANGTVSTLAGTGNKGDVDGEGDKAAFSTPLGIAVNNEGTAVYIADHDNNSIRKITAN